MLKENFWQIKKILVLVGMLVLGSSLVFAQPKEKTELLGQVENEEYVPKIIIEAKVGSGEDELGIISMLEFGTIGPNAIAVDKDENIYILDPVNTRIVKFDKNGKYIETINLEQRKIKIKTKHPERLFAEKNPKWYKEMYGKSPEDFPEYVEREMDAINFMGNFQEIQVDPKGNIYYIPGTAQLSQCYALVIYDKNGKIIRGYTKEELGEDFFAPFFYDLYVDKEENIYFKNAGQYGPSHGIEIDSLGKINKYEWMKLDSETKNKKFKDGINVRKEKRVQDLSAFSSRMKDFIKKSREQIGGYIRLVENNEGNIYEIVWYVKPHSYIKGVTEIIWDEKTLSEGVKVIRWQKIK